MPIIYPKCDQKGCLVQDETVECYEGYGVGIRLCPKHNKAYLDKMKELRLKFKDDVVKFKDSITTLGII